MNPATLLPLLGFNDEVVSWCSSSGINFSIHANALHIEQHGSKVAAVSVASGALKLLEKGVLGQNSKSHITGLVGYELKKLNCPDSVQSTIELALSGAGAPVKKSVPAKPATKSNPAFKNAADTAVNGGQEKSYKEVQKSKLEPLAPTLPAIPDDEVESVGAVTMTQMDSMTPVKLMEATMLYQPVFGTSEGSRYFVVAITQDLKVAARKKGTSLSIRVEGDVNKHKNLLVMNDISVHGHYASVHIECETDIVAARCIGAVITGLGLPMQTSVPLVKKLIGKGH